MRVLIRAFLDKNLGDDLFVYILCKRYPMTQFYIIGEKKYKEIKKQIPNLHFISEDSISAKCVNKVYKLCQRIRKKEVCNYRNIVLLNLLSRFFQENIFVTGSFFIQNPEWKGMLDSKWYDSRPYILGCNFGPYTSPQYYEEHKKQFQKAKKVCFREKYSYQMFQELSNVSVAPDLVFNLDRTAYPIREGDYYIISVVSLAKDNDSTLIHIQKKYVMFLVRIIEQMIIRQDRIVLMSFCTEQGDNEVIKEILDKVHDNSFLSIFSYEENGISKSLELISGCKGIIASRYHAMILGFLFQKKVLPVAYSDKMLNVLQDIEYAGTVINIKKEADVERKIDINTEMYQLEDTKISQLVNAAQEHFKELDKILM